MCLQTTFVLKGNDSSPKYSSPVLRALFRDLRFKMQTTRKTMPMMVATMTRTKMRMTTRMMTMRMLLVRLCLCSSIGWWCLDHRFVVCSGYAILGHQEWMALDFRRMTCCYCITSGQQVASRFCSGTAGMHSGACSMAFVGGVFSKSQVFPHSLTAPNEPGTLFEAARPKPTFCKLLHFIPWHFGI